jgi:outer membrane protein OmpA-like peptidoglycan-associated protein
MRLAELAGTPVALRIVGHADLDGGPEENTALSERRSRRFLGLLLSRGLDPRLFETQGSGVSRPVREERGEGDKAMNRSVTLEMR